MNQTIDNAIGGYEDEHRVNQPAINGPFATTGELAVELGSTAAERDERGLNAVMRRQDMVDSAKPVTLQRQYKGFTNDPGFTWQDSKPATSEDEVERAASVLWHQDCPETKIPFSAVQGVARNNYLKRAKSALRPAMSEEAAVEIMQQGYQAEFMKPQGLHEDGMRGAYRALVAEGVVKS